MFGLNQVGGLVGYNTGQATSEGGISYGTISNSYAAGNVIAAGNNVGGLVGQNSGSDGGAATISNSYATGSLSGNNDVGGLVGQNSGLVGTYTGSVGGTASVGNSYATGNVSGISQIGGLVGSNVAQSSSASASISYTYATGLVTGTGSDVGTLVGKNDAAPGGTASTSNSFWNGDVNGSMPGVGTDTSSGGVDTTTVASRSTAEIQTASSFTGFNFTTAPGAIGNNWVIVNADGSLASNASTTQGATTPMLASEYATTISNAHQLQLMAMDTTANYTLGANIDATRTSGGDVWGGAGFVPIAIDPSHPFSGAFDGLGHSISNLTINRPTTNFVGLFGTAGAGSVISNVGLLGASINGATWVGALAAVNQGSITNSYATGAVSGDLGIGGLVGRNDGSISHGHADASVSGSGSSIGGLVGKNSGGTILYSFATGAVSGGWGSQNIGGLVGTSDFYSLIGYSYATGAVSGGGGADSSFAGGGLVGLANWSAIHDSYATGSVSSNDGTGFAGGLVGLNNGNYNVGIITRNYAIGAINVTGTYTGGLIGQDNSGSVSNVASDNYWNTETTGKAASAGGTGLTTAQMQNASNFTGFNFTTIPGASGNNWVMVNGDGSLNGSVNGGTTPMLASEYSTTITNAHQLQLMAMAPAASYTLGANINATTTAGGDVWASGSFIPVGNATAPFSGRFDGLGHSISNLTINLQRDKVGLFGQTAFSAAVQNVGLEGGSVSGSSYVGALAGFNMGSISNSYATGNVSATGDSVGGLVGQNYGANSRTASISNSYATGSVTSTSGNNVGGLVGQNYGGTGSAATVSNSYATGKVSATGYNIGGLVGVNYANGGTASVNNSYATGSVGGSSYVGGLVGQNDGWYGGTAKISTSYAVGAVSGSSYVGGLVGSSYGTVNTSYWNTTTSGQAWSAGGKSHRPHRRPVACLARPASRI